MYSLKISSLVCTVLALPWVSRIRSGPYQLETCLDEALGIFDFTLGWDKLHPHHVFPRPLGISGDRYINVT